MRSRSVVVARRVGRQILRDRRSLAIIVLQPLLIISVFGYAFGGEVTDASIVVANLDRGGFAQEIIDRMDRETVDVAFVGSEPAAEAEVLAARVVLAIVFPPNFTRNLEGRDETAYIVLYKDNTNPQVVGAAQEALADAIEDAFEDETDRPTGGLDLDERVVFGSEDEDTFAFFVPGIAAYSIFMLGAMLTVVAIVKERTTGTLARLLASPLTRSEIVTGYVASFSMLTLVQALIVLGVSVLVFDVVVRGSILLALVVTALVGLVALGLGILVSGVAKNEYQAIQSVMFVAFPSLFLAGIFAPLEAMPPFLRPAAAFIPLSYAVRAMRDVINHGARLEGVLPDLLVLLAFALGFLAVAAVSFARRP